MSESKRELAIRMLKENACMFNSCLAKDELKHFKNYDFVQYLINCLSIPEHNYDNCHNATCKRKCRKDGYEQAMDSIKDKIDELSKYAEIQYNKAIDDFLKEICKMIVQSENNGNYRFYAVEIKQSIADLAEQLKEQNS